MTYKIPLNFRLKAKVMGQCSIVNFHQMETILPAQILMVICYYLALAAVNTMKRLVYIVFVAENNLGLYHSELIFFILCSHETWYNECILYIEHMSFPFLCPHNSPPRQFHFFIHAIYIDCFLYLCEFWGPCMRENMFFFFLQRIYIFSGHISRLPWLGLSKDILGFFLRLICVWLFS